jgi:hypothetical protein
MAEVLIEPPMGEIPEEEEINEVEAIRKGVSFTKTVKMEGNVQGGHQAPTGVAEEPAVSRDGASDEKDGL